MPPPASMLLVLPVPFREQDGTLLMEYQAHVGVHRWLENFETLIIAAPVLPEELAAADTTMAWAATDDVQDRVEFIRLPLAYTMRVANRHKQAVAQTLTDAIGRARYLQFAIGGLFGDWAGLAAQIAHRLHRPYAVHMDRVEHVVVHRLAKSMPPLRRIKRTAMAWAMGRYHHRLIHEAALSLCHGADCYAAYKNWSPRPDSVHNIHDLLTRGSDGLATEDLPAKVADAASAPTLRVCYAGRMDPEKAPLDWVRAIHRARSGGVNVRATWLGDGSLRGAVDAEIRTLNLGDIIATPGFVTDRDKVLQTIRESHCMLFTHITPESPRCLIEALRNATPIVGYDSPYPRDLISVHGGGVFAPMHNWQALGDTLASLGRDRFSLATLIQKAHAEGTRFSSTSVFRHRSDLVKQYLV